MEGGRVGALKGGLAFASPVTERSQQGLKNWPGGGRNLLLKMGTKAIQPNRNFMSNTHVSRKLLHTWQTMQHCSCPFTLFLEGELAPFACCLFGDLLFPQA